MRTSLLAVAPLLIAFAACTQSTGTGGNDGSGGDGGAAGGPTGTVTSSNDASSSVSTSGSSSSGSSACPDGYAVCAFCNWSPGLACTPLPGACCYVSCTDPMMPPFPDYQCMPTGDGGDGGTWVSVP